jgi:hypothetical protein
MKNTLILAVVVGSMGLFACGDSSAGNGGGGSASATTTTTTTTGTTSSKATSTSTGASGCTEFTLTKLAVLTPKPADGDYDYGSKTSALGLGADDQLELDVFNGLDTPTVDIETDAKNKNPSTCEACGWVFQDGAGASAPKIFYQASGTIALDVPNFGNQLSTAPQSVTLTDVIYREVTLTTAGDLYSAQFVAGGACLHLASASTL